MKRYSLPLCLLLASFGSELVEAEEVPLASINDAAAFLAGVELPHQRDHPLASTDDWSQHARRMQREFESHRSRVLIPMSDWSREEIDAKLVEGSTVRYLFSGPDIIHAFHMFPTADEFIMCGLEPVGRIPSLETLTTANEGRALAEVRNALGEIINFSFFRTKDMKEDLQFSTFHGTTPIIMIFLKHSGQYVRSVEFFELAKDGTLVPRGHIAEGADAVRIEFSPRRVQQSKSLTYFSSDLSNGGFKTSGFEDWLTKQPAGNAYLKAASYLMHSSWFSDVRDHLLDHSYQVVQDDSGIPFRHFPSETWDARLYGVYTGPIDLFEEYFQSDMRAAFQRGAEPLPFGTGYKWRPGQSNLMRMIRPDLVPE